MATVYVCDVCNGQREKTRLHGLRVIMMRRDGVEGKPIDKELCWDCLQKAMKAVNFDLPGKEPVVR